MEVFYTILFVVTAIAAMIGLVLFLKRRDSMKPVEIIDDFGIEPAEDPQPLEISAEPDRPESFGYKISWLAVPTEDTDRLAAALGGSSVQPANWRSGMGLCVANYQTHLFVSPPLDGWSFVVGNALPSFDDGGKHTEALLTFIERLAKKFPDFTYFGSHRGAFFAAWAKIENGSILRAFATADLRILHDQGPVTRTEEELEIDFIGGEDDEGEFPDEDDVLKLAAAWSLDPSTLDERTETGVGRLVVIK